MTDADWKVLGTTRRERVEDKNSIRNSVGRPLNELDFRNLPASSWALNAPYLHSSVVGLFEFENLSAACRLSDSGFLGHPEAPRLQASALANLPMQRFDCNCRAAGLQQELKRSGAFQGLAMGNHGSGAESASGRVNITA